MNKNNKNLKNIKKYPNTLDNIEDNYYKAYEKRYQQVYNNNYLWSSRKPTDEVITTIENENIKKDAKILEIGCGEGRDAIFLLEKNYNVLAIDYSNTVIEKCKELSNYKYPNNFKKFDIINDLLEEKFDFIYSIAVIHMFVSKKHREKFYNFIYNHINQNGLSLIVTMGDGIKEYTSDITKSFNNTKRTIINNGKSINVASTSCKIVSWSTFEKELTDSNLIIKNKWISNKIPEFDSSMCVLVSKK